MGLFKKLFEKISLTSTEIKVIIFLASVMLIGSGYKFLFKQEKNSGLRNFDYRKEDSLFAQAGISSEIVPETEESTDKKVDYKHEVLDFNERNFDTKEEKIIPSENSVNINTAGLDELALLPGIGIKTAQNIIHYRNEKGRIEKLEELLDVKGIGQSKLNKIKKYLYID